MNREPTSQFHPPRAGSDPRSPTKPEPGLDVIRITTHSTDRDLEEQHYHTPLTSNDSIRVLDLLPALDRRAPVRCRLREVALGRAGAKYEALSYVWGSPTGTRAITCDGRRLLVTPNCHDALVHLRRRLRPRALWIDAVCVDQRRDPASARERSRQVALMGAIYRTAALVVIWLGVARPQTARVLRLFRDLYRCRIELPKAHGLRKPLYRLVREVYDCSGATDGPAFADLLENPWLARVWTVQEVALARKAVVTIGHHKISWWAYAYALNFSTQTQFGIARPNLIRPRLGAVYIGGVGEARGGNIEDLVDLLHCIQHLQCKLTHDRVFGLYSILTQAGLPLSEPDYRRPVSHVFQELVVAFIHGTGSVAPIWMTLPADAATGLPSWVPNWLATAPERRTVDESGTFTLLGPRALIRGQQASRGSSAAEAVHDIARGTLRLRARRLAKILCRVSHIPEGAEDGHPPDPDDFVALCEKYCQYIHMTKGDASEGVLHELVRCVHARSPDRHLAGWFHTMLHPDAEQAAQELLQPVPSLPLRPAGDEDNAAAAADDDEDEPPGDYLARLRARYAGWAGTAVAEDLALCRRAYQQHVDVGARYAFVTLADGRLGRSHHSCRRGDDVFLVAGSNVPLVLRPHGAAAGVFRLVAPAYVAGVMQGELWPDDPGALEDITLV